MKKLILVMASAIAFCTTALSQDEKYTMAIESKMAAIDTVRKPEELVALSASFERIAEAEKTKWIPYYYAALTLVNSAYFTGMENLKADKVDPIADKAEALITKAESLSPKNSEIYIVKKMIASLRMMADPMNRYMTYGPKAEEALQMAMQINPNNPRVYLLQAQDKYFTPEQYGGSKEEAKKLFQMADKMYSVFKPASTIDPVWGKPQVDYFLAQMNK